MVSIAATEFARNFARYREIAQREPVAVTSHDRVTGYFVSAHDFEDFQRYKAGHRAALAAWELDDETIAAIGSNRMDPRHDPLNALLD